MNHNKAIETILETWNISEPSKRQLAVSEALSPDFYYSDPHRSEPIRAHSDFLDFLTMFRANVPNVNVSLLSPPDSHHNHARCRFIMKRNGQTFSSGTYIFEFDADGRINRMIGFMDQEPDQ
ncbi:MAG: hypothetical protein AAFV93_08830 [Chloroflexota bacterium]